MTQLKYISWNVNGLRACLKKGFADAFASLDADCFCLQETKLQPDQIELDLPGYYQYWNSAVKKDTAEQPYSPKKNRFPLPAGWGFRSMIRKAVSLRQNSKITTLLPAIRQTVSAVLPVWITA